MTGQDRQNTPYFAHSLSHKHKYWVSLYDVTARRYTPTNTTKEKINENKTIAHTSMFTDKTRFPILEPIHPILTNFHAKLIELVGKTRGLRSFQRDLKSPFKCRQWRPSHVARGYVPSACSKKRVPCCSCSFYEARLFFNRHQIRSRLSNCWMFKKTTTPRKQRS